MFRMIRFSAVFSLLLSPLAVCLPALPRAAAPAKPAAAQQAVEEASIQSALKEIESKKAADYTLSPADLLEISVYQESDLSRKTRVSQNGSISFPLIGTVKVGGLSVIEAEQAISKKLREYLVNPQVSLFILEYGNKQIYVLGEVSKPGSYPLPTETRLTVLEAVAMAGGFTPVAAQDKTKVIRNSAGRSQSFIIEVSAITKRGEKQRDIPLEPNDVVYIPQSFF